MATAGWFRPMTAGCGEGAGDATSGAGWISTAIGPVGPFRARTCCRHTARTWMFSVLPGGVLRKRKGSGCGRSRWRMRLLAATPVKRREKRVKTRTILFPCPFFPKESTSRAKPRATMAVCLSLPCPRRRSCPRLPPFPILIPGFRPLMRTPIPGPNLLPSILCHHSRIYS